MSLDKDVVQEFFGTTLSMIYSFIFCDSYGYFYEKHKAEYVNGLPFKDFVELSKIGKEDDSDLPFCFESSNVSRFFLIGLRACDDKDVNIEIKKWLWSMFDPKETRLNYRDCIKSKYNVKFDKTDLLVCISSALGMIFDFEYATICITNLCSCFNIKLPYITAMIFYLALLDNVSVYYDDNSVLSKKYYSSVYKELFAAIKGKEELNKSEYFKGFVKEIGIVNRGIKNFKTYEESLEYIASNAKSPSFACALAGPILELLYPSEQRQTYYVYIDIYDRLEPILKNLYCNAFNMVEYDI